jgi:glutathione S-transferase
MAFFYSGFRPRIANQMAAGDKEIMKWLAGCTFAKASTGHWLAWHADDLERVALLLPDHPEACRWMEYWEENPKIEDAIEYVESGAFETESGDVLNLFIQNPDTGKWE